jgi:uncharacterized protein
VSALKLRVVPAARAEGWAGTMPDGRIKVKIVAPPLEGRANEALVRFLAASLGLSRRSVRLAHGAGGRDKVVEVDLDPDELDRRLAACRARKEKE